MNEAVAVIPGRREAANPKIQSDMTRLRNLGSGFPGSPPCGAPRNDGGGMMVIERKACAWRAYPTFRNPTFVPRTRTWWHGRSR